MARRVLESPIEGVSPEEARARILDTYRQIRDSRVRDDDTDPVVSVLKLSGLTRVLEGYLVVRNRIYFRAFDRSWVEANLPEAEVLRQRRAARRAALRVGLLAGSVAVAIGALAVFGFVKANSEAAAKAEAKRSAVVADSERRRANDKAEEATRRAKEAEEANKQTLAALKTAKAEKDRADEKAEEARLANEQTKTALAQATREKQTADRERNRAVAAKNEADRERKKAVDEKNRADTLAKQEKAAREATDRLLYQANLSLIQTAFENNQFGRVQELLDETAKPTYAAFRGPEWGYWDYRMSTHLLELRGHSGSVSSASFSPDGTRVVTASLDNTARVWDARDGRELAALKGHTEPVYSASFSPDGTRVV
ncbi:MAG TPA: hypothetical protein PLL78_08465, partial [Fimbriimonadaceae bacterium]|nr:hypothetical protein [Fimbriimonadaceae bacterium]HRJ96709.1 hypothetical protein [Fimbriimonadaceae bacterium]